MLFVLLLVGILISSDATSLPSYIKLCNQNDRACYIKNGNDALPHLINGDKDLNLPELNPLRLERIEANAGDLRLNFKNVDLYGLDTVKVIDMDWDYGNQKIFIELDVDTVSLIGQYSVDGKIMVLPIQGDGPCNVTFRNTNLKYSLFYKIEIKGGLHYSVIESGDKLEWKVQKAYFRFDNLFSGNKAMTDNVNNFLNENDQGVLKEVGGAVTGIIKVVANKVYSAILSKVPLEELYLH